MKMIVTCDLDKCCLVKTATLVSSIFAMFAKLNIQAKDS